MIASAYIPLQRNVRACCPYESKRKHKSCCGDVKGIPAAKFIFSQTNNSRKSRKEMKQGHKRKTMNNVHLD